VSTMADMLAGKRALGIGGTPAVDGGVLAA
jgi:hypothetical protein